MPLSMRISFILFFSLLICSLGAVSIGSMFALFGMYTAFFICMVVALGLCMCAFVMVLIFIICAIFRIK